MRHLGCAKYLVFYVAATKFFFHCGARGGVEHLLFHLQTSERGNLLLEFRTACFLNKLETRLFSFFNFTVLDWGLGEVIRTVSVYRCVWLNHAGVSTVAYRGLVRGPRDEDPLITLCIVGVEAIQDVAGLLVVQEGKQEAIIVQVPALFRLSVGPQDQLL